MRDEDETAKGSGEMKDQDKSRAQLLAELAELREQNMLGTRSEGAPEVSEQRLRSLVEQTADPVFCYEYDPPIPVDLPVEEQVRLMYGCVLAACNDVCARSYGATRAEEVVGKELSELFGTATGSLDELFRALIEGGYRVIDGEGVETLADGTVRHYLNTGHGVVEDGKLVRVWGSFRDITEERQREEALRRSEATVQSVFEAAPVGICLMVDRVYQRASQDWCNTFGYKESWLIGRTTEFLYESRAEYERVGTELYADLIEKGKSQTRTRLKRSDGVYRDVDLVATPLVADDLDSGTVVVVHDITERKQAEEALQERIHLEHVCQSIAQTILSPLDMGDILDRLGQHVVDAGIFRSCAISVPDYDRNRVRTVRGFVVREDGSTDRESGDVGVERSLYSGDILAEAVRTGQLQVAEGWDERFDSRHGPEYHEGTVAYFIPVKKGEQVVAVLATGSTIEEKEATLEKIQGIGFLVDQFAIALDHARVYGECQREIAQRTQAEEALRESERLHRGAVEAAGAIPYSRDIQTDSYEFMGEGILALTGYSSDEITVPIMGAVNQEEIPTGELSGLTIDQARHRFYQTPGASWQAEVRMVTRSGREKWALDSSKGVYDDRGNLIRVVGMLQDITDRKLMEEEVRRTRNLESLGVLAGGIAHDFNNVLTGVTGNLALLQRLLDKESEEYKIAVAAARAADRTRSLTSQLMTFAKGGAPAIETASIEELIRETTDLSLRGTSTKPEYLFAEDLLPADIDVGQIGQAMQNLVLNADQAMPEGGTLKISAENVEVSEGDVRPLQPGTYVTVSLEDEGTGMSQDLLRKIFDPYFTTKEAGHGLGLAIVSSIVERHGGYVAVRSEIDVGTTFEVYLPASRGCANRDDGPQEELPRGTGRILLMDDEEEIHRTVGRMLRLLGYEVESARNGVEALESYQTSLEGDDPYDLVIIDLTIPGGMGGQETGQRLREMHPEARLVVSSGYASDPVMADCEAYGFRGKVPKPVDIEDLAETVYEVLRDGGD